MVAKGKSSSGKAACSFADFVLVDFDHLRAFVVQILVFRILVAQTATDRANT